MNRILTVTLRFVLCTTLSGFEGELTGKNVLVAGELAFAGLHGGRMGHSFDLPQKASQISL